MMFQNPIVEYNEKDQRHQVDKHDIDAIKGVFVIL
jgi:hypothetical protein